LATFLKLLIRPPPESFMPLWGNGTRKESAVLVMFSYLTLRISTRDPARKLKRSGKYVVKWTFERLK